MRKPDPVEIVAVGIPILAEVIAVLIFLVCCFVWVSIGATRHEPRMIVVHQNGERQ
jgi:hypothetical protein